MGRLVPRALEQDQPGFHSGVPGLHFTEQSGFNLSHHRQGKNTESDSVFFR